MKEQFVEKINNTKKTQLNKKIIIVGEDDEYFFFLDVKSKEEIAEDYLKLDRLFDKSGLLNEFIDIASLYRIKTENLVTNLERDEYNEIICFSLEQTCEISILKKLIESLNKENKKLPRLINLIKKASGSDASCSSV
ncbi:hypothetical protein MCRO_0358 [Mycoplasma crocodyli MP145]|uniref:Uncharacterized protein n=1 Tax=Mycoplasma crocodyli (strain ATCC 51981 / MP145) TaxID=512564 RepID=D5E5F2_MYCCM|nr:hypothetical protein MCRO_0358 [Mycoplasma crocodyli MP145]